MERSERPSQLLILTKIIRELFRNRDTSVVEGELFLNYLDEFVGGVVARLEPLPEELP